MNYPDRCDKCKKWIKDCTLVISSIDESQSVCEKCDQKERKRNQQIGEAENLLASGKWVYSHEFASPNIRRTAIENLERKGWICQKSSVHPRRFVWRAKRDT